MLNSLQKELLWNCYFFSLSSLYLFFIVFFFSLSFFWSRFCFRKITNSRYPQWNLTIFYHLIEYPVKFCYRYTRWTFSLHLLPLPLSGDHSFFFLQFFFLFSLLLRHFWASPWAARVRLNVRSSFIFFFVEFPSNNIWLTVFLDRMLCECIFFFIVFLSLSFHRLQFGRKICT